MARNLAAMIRTLIRRAPPVEGEPLPDGELLERFARSQDQAAFELLVWRHGGMVWSACRRILRNDHAAEDAFQATFLILARKAGSVSSASAAGYLHRVARRVALRAAKSRPVEALTSDPPGRTPPVADLELKAILDAEVDRLPERFRLPVVLCYLDGRTTEEAAKELGIPRGTVLSRLATARQKLTASLTRRGVAVPAVGLGLVGEMVPVEAVERCVGVSVRFSQGALAASLPSVQLAHGVLQMGYRKTVIAWATVLVATAGFGTGVAVNAGGKGQSPQPPAPTIPVQPPAAVAEKSNLTPTEEQKAQLNERRFRLTKALDQAKGELSRLTNIVIRNQEELADPSILKARSEVLSRIELELFQAQMEIRKQELTISALNRRITQDEKEPVSQELVNEATSLDPKVRQLSEALARQRVELEKTTRSMIEPEKHPTVQSMRAIENHYVVNLKEASEAAKPEAEKRIRVSRQKPIRETIAAAELELKVKQGMQDILKEEQVNLQKSIQENSLRTHALETIHADISRSNDKVNRIARTLVEVELEMEGVRLNESFGANLADSKLDRILRELAELRAEVKALKDKK